jgi:tripartite-type tricarboxylate transporter receptor subunit TctC
MKLVRALAVSILSAWTLAGLAWAQTYPDRPITLLVAFPPGGVDDATARIVQHPLQRALGQPIVIENLGGAGGMIAAAKVARAEPDGYTILLHQVSLATGMTLYSNLTFDAEKDFVAVGLVNTTAITLAGRPSLPPNNFDELSHLIKESQQGISVGHPGVGSFGHLATMLMFKELDAKLTLIPYRGAGPALVDLLASRVDLSPISAVIAGPLVNANNLKAYAVFGRKRFAGLPYLPTMGELGYSKLAIDFWHMLLAPAATPRAIVEKLNSALRAALTDAMLNKAFADGGMDLYPQDQETPEAAGALLKREIKFWGDAIRANHIAAQ